jgi:hypothetical protein
MSTGSSISTSSKIYRCVFYPAKITCFLSSTRTLSTHSGSCAEMKGFLSSIFRLLKLFKRMGGDSRYEYGRDEELKGDGRHAGIFHHTSGTLRLLCSLILITTANFQRYIVSRNEGLGWIRREQRWRESNRMCRSRDRRQGGQSWIEMRIMTSLRMEIYSPGRINVQAPKWKHFLAHMLLVIAGGGSGPCSVSRITLNLSPCDLHIHAAQTPECSFCLFSPQPL